MVRQTNSVDERRPSESGKRKSPRAERQKRIKRRRKEKERGGWRVDRVVAGIEGGKEKRERERKRRREEEKGREEWEKRKKRKERINGLICAVETVAVARWRERMAGESRETACCSV